jgi:hypothetical protein
MRHDNIQIVLPGLWTPSEGTFHHLLVHKSGTLIQAEDHQKEMISHIITNAYNIRYYMCTSNDHFIL